MHTNLWPSYPILQINKAGKVKIASRFSLREGNLISVYKISESDFTDEEIFVKINLNSLQQKIKHESSVPILQILESHFVATGTTCLRGFFIEKPTAYEDLRCQLPA